MTTHVIKRYTREHSGTGVWEDWQSHFISFDGKNADNEATTCMQSLAFGFVADSMKEDMTVVIGLDQPNIVKVYAYNGKVKESVTYIRTHQPNEYPNYSNMSEHHEV